MKSNLASLKTEVEKLDIDKLIPVPNDLAKLSNVVKNYVVKKTEYDKLVAQVDNTDTIGFVSRTKYEKDGSDLQKKISDVDKKIPDVSSLITKINFNAKVTEIEGKIPDVSNLVTKTNFNTKITEIEGKIPDISSLITKADFDFKLKKISDQVTSNKSKHLFVENELKKFKKLDLSYFWGENYFEGNDGTQNTLVFQVKDKYFEDDHGSTSMAISIWNSKGISKQSLQLVGTKGDPKMSKPIKPAHVLFSKENGILFQKKSDVITTGLTVNIYIV